MLQTDRETGQTDNGPIAQGEPFYKQSPKKPTEIDGYCKPWNHKNTSDWLVSDIAIFVLKKDVKLQLTN